MAAYLPGFIFVGYPTQLHLEGLLTAAVPSSPL
jgi:hypothetical protein